MSRIRSSDPRRAAAAASQDARPQLRDSVGLLAQRTGSAPSWIVTLDEVPVARVPSDTAEVLRLLDGDRSLEEIRRLAPSAPGVDELDALVATLRASGLLAEGPRRRARAIRVIPPLTVQFATTRMTPLFATVSAWLRPALRLRAARGSVLVVLAALLAAGAAAALVQGQALATVATGPLSLASLAAVALALVLATGVHELAHGVVLHLAGGTARRTGLMLFYLTPAFFVDVTDSWRLPGRRHRLAVALAGPAVHASAASLAALLGLALPPGDPRDAVLAFALAAGGITLLNLLPVVRFDGYYALVAATDTPHLRRRAREALDALVTGARGDRRAWILLLGAGSLIAPAVLVLLAYGRIARWSETAGTAGAVVVTALGALLVVVAVRACTRWIRRPGGRARRAVLLALVLPAALSAALVVPAPQTVTVGYVVADDGAWLVSTDGAALDALAAGAPVALETRGVLLRSVVGAGAVGEPRFSGPSTAPLESLAPVRAAGASVPVSSRALVLGPNETPPVAGAAVVRSGDERPALIAALDPLRDLVDAVTGREAAPKDHHEESR